MSEKKQWLGEEQDSSCDSDEQFTFNPIYPAAPALLDVVVTLRSTFAWESWLRGLRGQGCGLWRFSVPEEGVEPP